jgi:drug/metabolite transporter (DMT)-like permease
MNIKPTKIVLYLAFLVNVFLFGSSWMFNKMVLQEGATPIWAAVMRQSIAALVFLIVLAIKRPKIKLSRQDIKLIIIYAIFMMSLGHVLSLFGQKHIDSGLASIIFSFFPLAIVIISSILIPKIEPITFKKIAGSMIGLFGIILLFYTQGLLETGKTEILGIILILASVLVNSIPNVIIKRDGAKLDPIILNAGGMLIASFLLTISAFAIEGTPNFVLTKRLIFAELYLGILCSALGFFLYFWLLQHVSVFKLSLSAYITPMVAVFLGYIFYNEILSINHYIGMLLIFTGIFITEITYRGKHANKHLRLKGR